MPPKTKGKAGKKKDEFSDEEQAQQEVEQKKQNKKIQEEAEEQEKLKKPQQKKKVDNNSDDEEEDQKKKAKQQPPKKKAQEEDSQDEDDNQNKKQQQKNQPKKKQLDDSDQEDNQKKKPQQKTQQQQKKKQDDESDEDNQKKKQPQQQKQQQPKKKAQDDSQSEDEEAQKQKNAPKQQKKKQQDDSEDEQDQKKKAPQKQAQVQKKKQDESDEEQDQKKKQQKQPQKKKQQDDSDDEQEQKKKPQAKQQKKKNESDDEEEDPKKKNQQKKKQQEESDDDQGKKKKPVQKKGKQQQDDESDDDKKKPKQPQNQKSKKQAESDDEEEQNNKKKQPQKVENEDQSDEDGQDKKKQQAKQAAKKQPPQTKQQPQKKGQQKNKDQDSEDEDGFKKIQQPKQVPQKSQPEKAIQQKEQPKTVTVVQASQPKPQAQKQNLFAMNVSDESSSETSSESSSSEEESDQEEKMRIEEEQRKRKEELEKKRKEDEEKRKKELEEKKKIQEENKKNKKAANKKKEQEDDLAFILSQIQQQKPEEKQTQEPPKQEEKKSTQIEKKPSQQEKKQSEQQKEEQEGEQSQDEEGEGEGEGDAGEEKKLNKNQLKKLKQKQKKEAAQQDDKPQTATAATGKGKKPISKAAQLAAEKLQKQEQERLEKLRLEEEQKRQEEEEERQRLEKLKKEEEEKLERKRKKKEDKNLAKANGTYVSKKDKQKFEKNILRAEEFKKQLGLDPAKIKELKIEEEERNKEKKKKQSQNNALQFEPTQNTTNNAQNNVTKGLDADNWEDLASEFMGDQNDNQQQQEQNRQSQQDEEQQLQAAKASKKEQKEAKQAEKEAKQAAQRQAIIEAQQGKKKDKGPILRSPIVCILGHVDTGKTTLLDKLRNTNVQGGEAGGITQQIGATFFPGENVRRECEKTRDFYPVDLKAPGLLVIDTPGHESFANLRTRGSSLCDFAILVIDLMHGLEPQTIESLNLLRMRKTPFVIALNKIDRCYNWSKQEFGSSKISLEEQPKETKSDFQNRFNQVITQLAENSVNASLYWDKYDPTQYFPIVPTSGVTGEGIPDLLSVIIKYTSQYMKSKMVVKESEFNCTVMEVKKIDGLGFTIDAILIDGTIRQNDTIVILGFNGPIKTKIRALLTPHPMKEMRVKGEYEHHEVIHAAMGIKISAPDLENAVAGSQLFLANTPEDEEDAISQVMNDLDQVKNKVKLSEQGVGVAASTLGSLEALLNFLETSKIPVSYVSIGPVSKDDIMKALKSVLIEEPHKRKKEYACMLVFDVKVLPDAQKYAEDNGVKVFTANIIYHLFDFYTKYQKECIEERRLEIGKLAVFPCSLKIVAFFNKQNPIVMGVDVERGVLKPGTPICVYDDTKLKLGTVESIESNKKPVKEARRETGSVAIKIKGPDNIMAGRHFDQKCELVSIISRDSIDALKEHYRDDVTKDEWLFIKEKLKKFFNIP